MNYVTLKKFYQSKLNDSDLFKEINHNFFTNTIFLYVCIKIVSDGNKKQMSY